ncbi:MAG: hypothetical protein ACXADD_17910, partial [Candidatus Thorarchaeota archaeon]
KGESDLGEERMKKHILAIALAAILTLLVMAPLFWTSESYTLATHQFESEDIKVNADSTLISIIPGQGPEVIMEEGEQVTLTWIVMTDGSFEWGEYEIEEDGVIVQTGIYGVDIIIPPTYDIQHLSVGTHTITITAYDPYMDSVSDTVTVIVNPTESTLVQIIPGQGPDVVMVVGDQMSLSWTMIALTDYEDGVYEIEENGIIVETGIWVTTFPVVYDISHLSVGTHTITMTAYDPYMYSVSDTVTVTVNAEPVITIIPIHEPELEIELGQSVELEWDVITDDFEWGYYMIYVDNELVLDPNPFPPPWYWYVEEPIIFAYDDAVSGNPYFIGTHEIRLWLYGPSGDIGPIPDAFDITTVRVWPEEIPPVISHEDDVVKYEWSPAELSWTAHDNVAPYKYDIIEDGDYVESGDWENGVPIEYSLAHLSLGHHTISIAVYDTSGNSDSDTVEVEVLPPGGEFMPLMLKLSGSFDYLLKEDIHLQLAAFLVDTINGNPVTGATITFDIYGPDSALMLSGSFEEDFASGVYNYTYPDTFKDSKKDWVKGIYIVYAHATAPNGDEAVDMIQFHIDPPGGEGSDMLTNLVLVGFIGLLAFEFLRASRYVWRRRRLQTGGIGLG